jgi:hypothetical protein
MSVVMPPLLQSAQLKPDVTITSAESDDEIESDDDDRFVSPFKIFFCEILGTIIGPLNPRNLHVDY